jgi:hypothetical protein
MFSQPEIIVHRNGVLWFNDDAKTLTRIREGELIAFCEHINQADMWLMYHPLDGTGNPIVDLGICFGLEAPNQALSMLKNFPNSDCKTFFLKAVTSMEDGSEGFQLTPCPTK